MILGFVERLPYCRSIVLPVALLSCWIVAVGTAHGDDVANEPVATSPQEMPQTPEQFPVAVPPASGLPPQASDAWQAPEAPIDRLLLPTGQKTAEEQAPPTAREMLDLYQIPSSRLNSLVDGGELLKTAEEADLLLRIMYRYPEIPRQMMERWGDDNAPAGIFEWSKLATDPDEYRGKVFPLKGRVIEVKKLKPDAAATARYQLHQFYRVRLELNGSTRIADIFTHQIPNDWKQGEQTNMQSGALAMFLKRGDARDPADPLVFVTDRVAWYRDTLLCDLGVDAALFDHVVNGRGIVGADRELFYEMLDAVNIPQTNELVRFAQREIDIQGRDLLEEQRELNQRLDQASATATSSESKIAALKQELRILELRIQRTQTHQHELIPLLEHPRDFEGKLMMYRAVARRILKVKVPDKDIRERFGIDHYYQIDAIVELEIKVKLPSPKEGEPARERWSYPVTFCVRNLPAGLPVGDHDQEDVLIAGFFFKNWSYFLDAAPGKAEEEKFVAPMLIGREPIWIRPADAGSNPFNGAIAGLLFVVALLGVWVGVWHLGRGDHKFQQATLKRSYALGEGVSLNDLDFDDRGKPDFSYLNDPESESTEDAEEVPAQDDEQTEPARNR